MTRHSAVVAHSEGGGQAKHGEVEDEAAVLSGARWRRGARGANHVGVVVSEGGSKRMAMAIEWHGTARRVAAY